MKIAEQRSGFTDWLSEIEGEASELCELAEDGFDDLLSIHLKQFYCGTWHLFSNQVPLRGTEYLADGIDSFWPHSLAKSNPGIR